MQLISRCGNSPLGRCLGGGTYLRRELTACTMYACFVAIFPPNLVMPCSNLQALILFVLDVTASLSVIFPRTLITLFKTYSASPESLMPPPWRQDWERYMDGSDTPVCPELLTSQANTHMHSILPRLLWTKCVAFVDLKSIHSSYQQDSNLASNSPSE